MHRRDFLKGTAAAVLAAAPPGGRAASKLDAGYFRRIERFDEDDPADLYADADELALIERVVARLARVQRTAGHGNFHLLGVDEMLEFARAYSRIGAFEAREIAYLERIFHRDAERYGFYGEKVLRGFTDVPDPRAVFKVRGTGQYLYRGPAEALFARVQRSIGRDLQLTSGVRGIVKQSYLFLRKAVATGGNLSRASRSLAPPGYSFHGIGDFDVGQRGLGHLNFTNRFADSDVCRRLLDMGLVDIRYPRGNPYGVRFEPWHVRVV